MLSNHRRGDSTALFDVDSTLVRGKNKLNVELLEVFQAAEIKNVMLFTSMSLSDVVMSSQTGYLSRLDLIAILQGQKRYKGKRFDFNVEAVVTPTDPARNEGLGQTFTKVIQPLMERVQTGALNDALICAGSDKEYELKKFEYSIHDCLVNLINQIIQKNIDGETVKYIETSLANIILHAHYLCKKFNYEPKYINFIDDALVKKLQNNPAVGLADYFATLLSLEPLPPCFHMLLATYNINDTVKVLVTEKIDANGFWDWINKNLDHYQMDWLKDLDIKNFKPAKWDKGSMYAYVRKTHPDRKFVYADDKDACLVSAQVVETRLALAGSLTTVKVDPSKSESPVTYALAIAKVSPKALIALLRAQWLNLNLPLASDLFRDINSNFATYFGNLRTSSSLEPLGRILFRLDVVISKVNAHIARREAASSLQATSRRLREMVGSAIVGVKIQSPSDFIPKLQEMKTLVTKALMGSGYWTQCIVNFADKCPQFQEKVTGKARKLMSPAEKLQNAFADFYSKPIDSDTFEFFQAIKRYTNQDATSSTPSISADVLQQLEDFLGKTGFGNRPAIASLATFEL